MPLETSLLKISGSDAARFLQNQSTNDVAQLKPGESQPNASVDRQGKVQGVYTLYKENDNTFYLLAEKSVLPNLVAHFSKFKIIDDVHFEEVSLADVDIKLSLGSFDDTSHEIFETARVEAGFPKYGVDYDFETMLPETGLQQTHVSYDKGCYLGQEVIARVKTYGTLQKALCGLLLDESVKEPPPVNTPITADNKTVGETKSAVFSPTLNRVIALAYLDKSHRVPGKKVSVNGADAEVTMLPFIKPGADEATGLREKALRMFSQGDEESAVKILREAIEKNPNDADTYEALGAILGRSDATLDDAMRMMERVLEIDSDHVMAHTNLSIFWLKKGDKDKAEDEKAKATIAAMRKKAKESGLALPDPEEAKRRKEAMLNDRIAMFSEALKQAPDDPLGNFGLGSAYLELEHYAEAVEPLEKVIKAQPKHTVAYLSLGKALAATGQSEEARKVFEKGLEVAAARGDMMPLQEMQKQLSVL